MIDHLGLLRAQIADLQAEAKLLEQGIKAGGAGRYAGGMFEALVFEQRRETTDWKAVAARLEPSRQLVAAHTTSASVLILKLAARKAA